MEPGLLAAKLDSIGKAIPGVTMRVIDEQGNELPRGEHGDPVPQRERLDLFPVAFPHGEYDDRDLAPLAQLPAHFESVQSRHDDIQQHQIGLLSEADIQRRLTTGAVNFDGKTFSPEMWTQFMNVQAPIMQGMMNNYIDQSKSLFVQMQEQMQKNSEQMLAALYQNHPYRIPIIGWMHEIEGLNREHALGYFRGRGFSEETIRSLILM